MSRPGVQGSSFWAEDSGISVGDKFRVASGEDPRGEKMLLSGTDPESYITEYT